MEELPILILLLVLSGFFSGAEIALFSLGPEKIQALKNKAKTSREKKRAARLELVKSDVDKLLVTILIGNNVVNVAASSMATVVALKTSQELGMGDNSSLIIGVVTGVMTFLILIFGEIIPKVFAHKYALKFSLWVAPIIQFLSLILWPLVTPIAYISKQFSGKEEKKHGLSEDEIKAVLELSENEGQIEKGEKELFERVLEFDQHKVEAIMTPRSKIFSLPDNMPTMEALAEIKEASFSRIPIFHEDSDNIVGILRVQSLVEEFMKDDFREKNLANLSLLPPMKIPLTMKIDTLLRKFQAEKTHLALVFNEHGGMIGLITLEDIMEEIFGEFEDEEDEEVILIQRTGKNSFNCLAEVELEQIEKFVEDNFAGKNYKYPWTVEDENNTLAYFLLKKLERFPEEGEIIKLKEDKHTFIFNVQKVNAEQIQEVLVTVK